MQKHAKGTGFIQPYACAKRDYASTLEVLKIDQAWVMACMQLCPRMIRW